MLDTQPTTTDPNTLLYRALRKRYEWPAYAYFGEVRDATGMQQSRSLDAMVLGLWPSRGLELIGIECKVSRSDWLRELKDHSKADRFFRFCDRFFLAVSDSSIVRCGELPPQWGLLCLCGGSLRVKTEAPKLEPGPVDRSFLAALIQRAIGPVEELKSENARLRQAVNDAESSAKSRAAAALGYSYQRTLKQLETLETAVAEFEARSGLKIDTYNGASLGALVAEVKADRDAVARRKRIKEMLAQVEHVAEHTRSAIAALGIPEESTGATQ